MINRRLIRQKVVQLTYAFYQNPEGGIKSVERELERSLDAAYDLYEYLLSLLVSLRGYAQRKGEADRARAERLGTDAETFYPGEVLARNRLLLQLEENEELAEFRAKRLVWEEEPVLCKRLYDEFTESEAFQIFLQSSKPTYAEEREIVRKLYKNLICHNEDIDDMLEAHGLYWNDDKTIVDSFVLKTIKRFTEERTLDEPLLPKYDSEEDERFAPKLLREALERKEEITTLIAENLKNWELNRLALMDRIIMQVALAEILSFPQIPLTVSLNEYIELAKAYSTPKSSIYINGLLDHIVKLLQKQGTLLKKER